MPLLLGADPAHYQQTCATRPEEAWRDPWVVQDADGLWHMYVTARDVAGLEGCGVVGHATSSDLLDLDGRAPAERADRPLRAARGDLGRAGSVAGGCCCSPASPTRCRDRAPAPDGTWSVPVEGPGALVDVASAVRLTDERWYVAHVVEHAGTPYVLAFRNAGDDGGFVGEVGDPLPVRWRADGRGIELVADSRPVAESIEHAPGHPTGEPLV